jgi:pimeloyl-ACP methyl ester carboxylesterase
MQRARALPTTHGIRWLTPDGRWSDDAPANLPTHAVLLVHGLDEPGGIWDQLAPALAEHHHPTLRFDYPNDQPASDSADQLRDHLEQLRDQGVTSLDIVAHSMGGLIARDVLTRALSDRMIPEVPVLITLGTPHAGSPWAGFQPVAEVREHLQRWIESEDLDPARLFAAWHDGLGQAREDLRPNSPYLKELNSRPWPGTTRLIAVVAVIGAYNPDSQPTSPQDQATLTAKLGDGVVPVDSAQTPFASETLFVRANHRSMIRAVELDAWARTQLGLTPPPEPPAIPLILNRLTPPLPLPPPVGKGRGEGS